MDDEHAMDMRPLVPMMLPPHWAEPEPPAATARRSTTAPMMTPPAYGLVGVPASSTVTMRDAKVGLWGLAVGAALASALAWLARRSIA